MKEQGSDTEEGIPYYGGLRDFGKSWRKWCRENTLEAIERDLQRLADPYPERDRKNNRGYALVGYGGRTYRVTVSDKRSVVRRSYGVVSRFIPAAFCTDVETGEERVFDLERIDTIG